jgi:superfamily II DNA or RNA helicase
VRGQFRVADDPRSTGGLDLADSKWGAPSKDLERLVSSQLPTALENYKRDRPLFREHVGLEAAFRTGGYSDRQLTELIQNASDAILSAGGRGDVEVVLTPDALYCANEGAPFTKKGIDSITHAYVSTKRGQEIGRYGLGFKAVLAVSENVQIFSSSVSFEFGSSEALEALRSVEPTATSLPVLRTPTLVDVKKARTQDPLLDELCTWASTVVKVPLASRGSLEKQIDEFRAEFLLFAQKVQRLRVRTVDAKGNEQVVAYECEDNGDGCYTVGGTNSERQAWRTLRYKHEPSAAAKKEVAESIARDSFYITYATPLDGRVLLGEFWANFPLETKTSASGIFNAPWALNEDRTNILAGKIYNDEIVDRFAEMFLEVLPTLSTEQDPARHLLYMPSRAREVEGPIDRRLITRIQYGAAHASLIPAIDGALVNGREVRALHHSFTMMPREMFQLWADAPHLPKDFPHPGCYATGVTRSRLRELHRGAYLPPEKEPTGAEPPVPSEAGLATWLGALARGDDTMYSRVCIRAADRLPREFREEVGSSRIVALAKGGFARLSEGASTFLPPQGAATLDGYTIVHHDLVGDPEVVRILEAHGFRRLAPETIMEHLLRRLDGESTPGDWEAFWNAVDDVPVSRAIRILRDRQSRGQEVRVRAADGSWADPRELFDLSGLGISTDPSSTLAPRSIDPKMAQELGVNFGVSSRFPVVEEAAFGEYRQWAEIQACAQWGIERESVEGVLHFDKEYAPGPIGLLGELQADPQGSMAWSKLLVEANAEAMWTVRFPDGDTSSVLAPHLWAAFNWGYALTTQGLPEKLAMCVDPTLRKYGRVLPVPALFALSRVGLPRDIADLDPDYLRERLEGFSAYRADPDDATVAGALLTSAAEVFIDPGDWPSLVPAVIARDVVPVRPDRVYVARDADEVDILRHNGLAYVLVESDDDRATLVTHSPLNLAEKAIRFEVRPIEPGDPVALTELFPGIRPYILMHKQGIAFVPVSSIVTRQTTPAGTTDEVHERFLVADAAYVSRDPYAAEEQSELLQWLNDEAGLGLSAAQISEVIDQLNDARLAELRNTLLACRSDAERLGKLFDADELRAKLPAGLVESLEALGKTVSADDLPRLFLDAHGFEAVSQLRDQLGMKGLVVPQSWAGSMRARQFVTDLGFDARFAGDRGTSKPTSEIVLGKPGLGELHDFQREAVKGVRFLLRSRRGHADKGLVELPTGAGKTRVAVEATVQSFLDHDFERPGHILWVAQSRELCEQAITSWSEVWREFSDNRSMAICRFFGQYKPEEPDNEVAVVVATDAMLLEHIDDEAFAWVFDPLAVVIDEAHRAATSTTYTQLLRKLNVHTQAKERPLLGLSATPFYGHNEESSKRLAERFGKNLIQTLGSDPIRELQERRILAHMDHEVLEGSSMRLDDQEVGLRRISPSTLSRIGKDQHRMRRIVGHVMSQPSDWKILVFMPSVLSAQVLAAVLRSEKVKADSVSGESSRRRREDVIERFKTGDVQVLVNCDLLTQGFDAPLVRALYIARPTLNLSRYIQMVGRGLRGPKNNGSERCLVVDLEDTVENGGIDLAYRDFETYWNRD